MAQAKDCHALVTYFVKKYEEVYGFKPTVNRHSARWGFDSILSDLSSTEAKSLIDYYFRTESAKGHPLDWFFYNYDKLLIAKAESDVDADRTAKLREESKKRAEEWRKSGKQGIADN